MNVLYLSQLFETGADPGSDRHLFLCRLLVERGHRVTALTANVDYKRATAKFPGGGWSVRQELDGIEVRYLYAYPHFRGSFPKRMLYFATYVATALVEGARLRNVEAVYAVSTPLSVGLLGYLVSRFHRARFYFEVTDVWPDAAVATGVVKNKLVIKAAEKLERFCYRKARRIIALTAGIRSNLLSKGVAEEKVLLVTNGVDPVLFPVQPDAEPRSPGSEALGKTEPPLICMYLGAHGRYNALDTIIDAARALRGDPRFLFVLVGDGDEKKRLEEAVRAEGLRNVQFRSPVARSEAAGLLKTADLFLLPNRKGAFFRMNLPNKLFDYLVSARPVVVCGEGESADLVSRAGAGLAVGPEDGSQLAKTLDHMAGLGARERAAMGVRGREYVLRHFDRANLFTSLAVALEREAS